MRELVLGLVWGAGDRREIDSGMVAGRCFLLRLGVGLIGFFEVAIRDSVAEGSPSEARRGGGKEEVSRRTSSDSQRQPVPTLRPTPRPSVSSLFSPP